MAIAGIGGYGDYCLGLMERFADPESYELARRAIDPFYDSGAARRQAARRRRAALPSAGTESTPADSCELRLIPPARSHLHRAAVPTAFPHGSRAAAARSRSSPVLQDAREIEAAARKAGVKLGVGFQMSSLQAHSGAEARHPSGLLGKPLTLKSCVSWQRFDSYYNSPVEGPPARPKNAKNRRLIPSSPTPPRTICTTPSSSSVRTWAVPDCRFCSPQKLQRQGHRNV